MIKAEGSSGRFHSYQVDLDFVQNELHNLLLSSQEQDLSLGLSSVSKKQDNLSSMEDLIFILDNNQAAVVTNQIETIVQIVNQKISKNSLENKQQNKLFYQENSDIENFDKKQKIFFERIDDFLNKLHKRTVQIVAAPNPKVFRPLVQMMNLLDEQFTPKQTREMLRTKIAEIISDLTPMKSLEVKDIILENCIPTFDLDHVNLISVKYIGSVDNRISSIYATVMIRELATQFAKEKGLNSIETENYYRQIIKEVDNKFDFFSSLGHIDLWAEALVILGQKIYGKMEITQLEEDGLSKPMSKSIRNVLTRTNINHQTIFEYNSTRYVQNSGKQKADELVRQVFENRSLISENQDSEFRKLVYLLFADQKEPPTHELERYKKHLSFMNPDFCLQSNLLLEIMLSNCETNRYQIGALLSVFPYENLSLRNRRELNLVEEKVPLNLRQSYESKNLCNDAERNLWNSMVSEQYFVLNNHLLVKGIGAKTAYCIESFVNQEGYVFYEGIYYRFINNQDLKRVLDLYDNGLKFIESQDIAFRMLRAILPYKGITGSRQVREIREFVNELSRSMLAR